jgi:glycosyltransferase involved in cell wall biosynthesis
MACGIPVVITDFGDNYKWVKNDVNGFLVPLKNPDALAEKIIYLLKNPEVCRVFGEKNRMIIEEKNNFDEEMEKIEDLYIDLIQRC